MRAMDGLTRRESVAERLARVGQLRPLGDDATQLAVPQQVVAVLRAVPTRAAGGKKKRAHRLRPVVGVRATDLKAGVI